MDTDTKEIAIKNYEIASQQLNTRARLRDNALLTYLTFTGTIFGIVLGTSTKGSEGYSIVRNSLCLQSIIFKQTAKEI